jgi:hypothetical protein
VAQCGINLGCHIQFPDNSILAKKSTHIIREVTETVLHSDNMNREEGFSWSMSWNPPLKTLKK